MKVTLLAYTPEPMRVMTAGALLCYSKGGPEDAWERAANLDRQSRLLTQCIEMDHGSVLEHASFTFGIEGISRACSHQLVRHRLCSFSQQSQRYVDLSEDCWEGGNFVVPESLAKPLDGQVLPGEPEWIEDFLGDIPHDYTHLQRIAEMRGLRGEEVNQDARYILPNACKTNLIWTLNFRQLLHVGHVRLCQRAQWEIREMMEQVRSAMLAVHSIEVSWLASYLYPACQFLGYCPQGERGCGDYPTKDAVIECADEHGLYLKTH